MPRPTSGATPASPVTATDTVADAAAADVPTAASGHPGAARRRQRSVRVSVAVGLLSVATLLVVAALLTGSATWTSLSSVVALACGWAAARIIHTELAQSRRDAAVDRAEQAAAYRRMFAQRADEHAAFTTAMHDRLSSRERQVEELSLARRLAEQRVTAAEDRVRREARRAVDAQQRVGELTSRVEELEAAQAERADELAVWTSELDGSTLPDLADLAGLVAWEQRVSAGSVDNAPERRHA